ncbi:MAG: hypothetical protein LBT94_05295 [Prevotellaceae bacterium]|jgi:hypothetical protein|nr:hypothetical protein [Prevotellaceae bacterium]
MLKIISVKKENLRKFYINFAACFYLQLKKSITMKKNLLTLFAAFALSMVLSLDASARNYEKSIGVRLGLSDGVTYKQFVSRNNAIEVIGNAFFISGGTYLGVSGEYLWSWNVTKELSWFIGPGVSAGVWTNVSSSDLNAGFNAAFNGMAGFEYKFAHIPLALSLDVLPHIYLLNGGGISPLNGALSIRYTF